MDIGFYENKIVSSFKLFEDKKDRNSDLNKSMDNIINDFESFLSENTKDSIKEGLENIQKKYDIIFYRCTVLNFNSRFEEEKDDDLKRLSNDIKKLLDSSDEDLNIELFIDTEPKTNKKRIYKLRIK